MSEYVVEIFINHNDNPGLKTSANKMGGAADVGRGVQLGAYTPDCWESWSDDGGVTESYYRSAFLASQAFIDMIDTYNANGYPPPLVAAGATPEDMDAVRPYITITYAAKSSKSLHQLWLEREGQGFSYVAQAT